VRARRALLYVPADDWRKIQKATTLGVDCICLDLEDGVAQNRKGEARQNIARALATLDFGRAERLVRMFSFVGDTVLDPFAGTGTTLVAAARWGRRALGIELVPQYAELARDRFAREVPGKHLSLE
jgi:spermidine synthase